MFSVIIATRCRVNEFQNALSSVLQQEGSEFEVIVVNDGSSYLETLKYNEIVTSVDGKVSLYDLPWSPVGHGPSYARNFGASYAKGEYLCFLDDDDVWIDKEYLSRVESVIASYDNTPDLLLSAQWACYSDQSKRSDSWLSSLDRSHEFEMPISAVGGFFRVGVIDLLNAGGLSHMNTTIVKRELYDVVGGMDEGLRWEEDRDFFLRLLDHSKFIMYSRDLVALHNVPDSEKSSNASTSLDILRRRLYQIQVFDKACILSRHPSIRAYGRSQKGYTLKRVAILLANNREYDSAYYYAMQAMGALPTLKWLLYTLYLKIKMILYTCK